MDSVQIAVLAGVIMRDPSLKNRVLYPGTRRVNREALSKALKRLQFAADAAINHDSHVPSRNAGNHGGPKLKQPTPGKHSGTKPDYNWA
jgi:hypothetical protein